ncbi:MAG TPA: ATPase [Chloroflexi bacterium]|nr:ATPase [Chloroflexota bacterium]
MDILHLVDRLEEVIKEGARLPLGALRMVDERHVWPLIDQMRISIPEEVRQAERTIREKDRTMAQTQEEAERIINLARSEAAKLSAEHAITQQAKEQAAALLEQAEQEAESIRSGADEYAFDILCNLEQELKRALSVIENGIRTIQIEREEKFSPSNRDGSEK